MRHRPDTTRSRTAAEPTLGQILPLFALALVAILGLMGLGLDAAQAFLERRESQGVADLAALSGARHLPGDPTGAYDEAKSVGVANGYAYDKVIVTTNYQGSPSKIKVTIDSHSRALFLPVLGISDLDVNAGAGAVASGAAASCSFCSLNGTDKCHTLLLKNGSTLRVDGDIIVNSTNGGTGPDCPADAKKQWQVCGDGFDIFGSPSVPPAYISAQSIQVAGGWETHDQNVVVADSISVPDDQGAPPTYVNCPTSYPSPAAQTQTSNVCIHRPRITDPLNDPGNPAAHVTQAAVIDYPPPAGTDPPPSGTYYCPQGTVYPSSNPANTTPLTIASTSTICPGTYYGGLKITGGTTTMLPGVYYMKGKNGFVMSNAASVDGSSGVMIYSSASTGGTSTVNILPDPDLAAPILSARKNVKTFTITSDHNPGTVGQAIKYTAELEADGTGPAANGVIEFYDGDTKISPTGTCPTVTVTNVTKKKGWDCTVTYGANDVGYHGIAAVFASSGTCNDATCLNNAEAILDPRQEIITTTETAGDIKLTTTGNVRLSGVKSGPYKGIVLFQDRNSTGDILLQYGSGLGACGPADQISVNGVVGPRWALERPAGDPCGALGGIDGTIYAANDESLVTTTVSGLADMQIIAGMMLIDSTSVTRFAFDASKFAGNRIALFE